MKRDKGGYLTATFDLFVHPPHTHTNRLVKLAVSVHTLILALRKLRQENCCEFNGLALFLVTLKCMYCFLN